MAIVKLISNCNQLPPNVETCEEEMKKLYKYRFFILFLCILGTFLEYSDRANINNAIVSMVTPSIITTTKKFLNESMESSDLGLCPGSKSSILKDTQGINFKSENRSKSIPIETFDWDPTTQGAILGSFFYGYILLQIPAGRFSEIFGGKWIVFISVLTSGLINVATPFLAYSVPLLIMGRALMGMFQGVVYPACFSLICNWMSPTEKSLSLALLYSGANMGIVFAASLTGYLSEKYGWRASFYLIGSITLIFSLVWLIFAQSNPPKHCPVPRKENYGSCSSISSSSSCSSGSCPGSKKLISSKKQNIPWKGIFSNKPFLSSLACRFGAMLVILLLQTKLPGYLSDVLQVSSSMNGMINSVVYIGASISMTISPYLSEIVIRKEYLSRTNTRKAFSGVGLYICVIGFLLLPLIHCNQVHTLLVLIAIVIGCGLTGGGDIIIPAEITKKYPATIYSIINCIVSIIGIFVPLVIGMVLQSANTFTSLKVQWDHVFNFSAIIVAISTTAFLFFGSAELQESIDGVDIISEVRTPETLSTISESESSMSHERKPNINSSINASSYSNPRINSNYPLKSYVPQPFLNNDYI